MSGAFVGAWRVAEHVHDPDGSFVGVVRQRRRLEREPDGALRVIQDCEPEGRLAGHPMARFEGRYEFTLRVDGAQRRYRGPDVIGGGMALGPSAIIGRGLWPGFGHSFTSYGLVPTPTLQLTGGTFFVATEPVAVVVGVATPEAEDDDAWPTLHDRTWPGDVAAEWVGRGWTVSPAGRADAEHEVRRAYAAGAFDETGPGGERVELERDLGGFRLTGRSDAGEQRGVAKSYGPVLCAERCREGGELVESMDFLDAARGHLVSVHRVIRDHVVTGYRVALLRPAAA